MDDISKETLTSNANVPVFMHNCNCILNKENNMHNLRYKTTNMAKEDGNMHLLNFHMFHIGLLPGVFQNILWAREESFKIYSGCARSLSKYALGTS